MTPAAWASRAEPKNERSPPSTASEPASGRSTPERILTNVLLPAPLSPTSAVISPGRTSIAPFTRACTAPKALLTPRAARVPAPSAGGTLLPPRLEHHGQDERAATRHVDPEPLHLG